MGFFKNIGEKLDTKVAAGKTKTEDVKQTVGNMDQKEKKLFKYSIYAVVILLFLFLGSCMVRSCNAPQQAQILPQEQYPVQQAAQAPVVVQQPSSGIGDMITGGAIGYMLGRSSQPQIQQPQVIERRTVVNRYVNRPITRPAPVVKSPAVQQRMQSIQTSRSINRSSGFKSFSRSSGFSGRRR